VGHTFSLGEGKWKALIRRRAGVAILGIVF